MSKKGRRILLALLAALVVAIQVVIIRFPNNGIIILPNVFDGTSCNVRGVLQSLMVLLCVLMVCTDMRVGRILTRIFLGISTLSLTISVFRTKQLESLPGAVSLVIGIVTCEVISKSLLYIEMESVTDLVTKLLNRRGLLRELNKRNTDTEHFHIMFIHVKNIKTVNDNLGYGYGDAALRILADRIRAIAGSKSIISKLDGTEFAVAIPHDMDITVIPRAIVDDLSKSVSFDVDGVSADFYFNVYAGVANYPDDANSIEKLMKYADIAMYHASHSSTTNLVYFNNELEEEIIRRTQVENYIQESLKNDYFFLVYQPQYSAVSKKLRGFEALLRLTLPDGTRISPGEFIPIAEKTNLISKIDDYVCRRAMKEFAESYRAEKNNLVLAINVSAKDISNPSFPERVLEIAKQANFPVKKLEIEITEYSLYESLDQTITNIKTLRAAGVKFALDDFGTGYTALSQLLKIPFELLKIDKSLVDTLETSEVSKDFITLVIYMGHLMGSEVIAEGVETETQLTLLKNQECDFIQGFVWSRPLAYEDAVDMCFDS